MEKRFIIFFFTLCSLFASAQSRKQLKQHRKSIVVSAGSHSALLSLDTFFCSGLKLAVIRNDNSLPAKGVYCFRDLKTGDTLLLTNEMSDVEDSVKVFYFNCYFPALHAKCDVNRTKSDNDIFEIICKYKLFNKNGLDTFKAETLISIKGNHQKKQESKDFAHVNYQIVERNRNSQIKVVGNDIYQDSLLIGSFEETTLETPKNGKFKQIRVFNTQKQIVCFSTEIKEGSHEWRLATNMDGKYHLIRSDAAKDKDLYEILSFLIKQRYL